VAVSWLYRFPPEIIAHAVWLYFRFNLSFRDVQDLLAERGVIVSHETIRQWCTRFGAAFAGGLRRRRARAGDKWHLDEVMLKINGKRHWLWRAVDQNGVVLDILVQSRRDQQAAERFLRQVVDGVGYEPRVVITDKLASYRVLRLTMTSRCKSGQRRHQGTFVVARRRSGRPGRRSAGSSPPWEGATHRSAASSEACRVAKIDP
jgi:putative transposase